MAIKRSVQIDIQAGKAKAELNQLSKSLRNTDTAARGASKATLAFSGALATLASLNTARSLQRTADSYTSLQNKIRTTIDDTSKLGDVTDRLFNISNKSLTSIGATTSLYQKLSLATKGLNRDQSELFRVIETVAKSTALANDGAQSASAALTQLGQAFGGDFKASSQEFNSILEQTPALGEAIADGLGVAVPQLKRLGEQGLLSSELVFNSLLKVSDSVDKNFGNVVATVDNSLSILDNAFIKYIGEADKAIGVTKSISESIQALALNFDEVADSVIGTVVPALEALAVVYTARLASGITATASARLVDVAAIAKQAQAEKSLAAAALSEAEINARNTGLLLQQAKQRTANFVAIKRETGAKTGLTAATTALAKANQTNIGATNALTAATARYAAAAGAATVASRATAGAAGLARGAMALLGGPVGVAVTAATALLYFGSSAIETKRDADELRSSIGQLSSGLDELSKKQASVRLIDIEKDIQELERAKSAADGLVETYNVRASGGFAVDSDKLTIAIGKQETATNDLNTALKLQGELQDIVNGTYSKQKKVSGTVVRSLELQTASYLKLKGSLDSATKIYNDYNDNVKEIIKLGLDQTRQTELLALATKKRDESLKRLNEKTIKAAAANDKLHRSYADLLGEFNPAVKAANDFADIFKEIEQSTASQIEKEHLRAEAYKQLNENLADATTTTREFLATYDPLIAADIARDNALKALAKTQGSKEEKDRAAIEINKQHAKAVDDATDSYLELNAQYSAVDAATLSYVNTLKKLDSVKLDDALKTDLQTKALQSYMKAAKDAEKQDRLNQETNQSFLGALSQGLEDSAITAESSFDQIREVGQGAIGDLSSAISNFISTGEGDFRSFAAGIVTELLKIQTQALIVQGLDLFKNSDSGSFIESVTSGLSGLFGGPSDEGSADASSGSLDTGGGGSGAGEIDLSALDTVFSGEDSTAGAFEENWLSSLDNVSGKFGEVFTSAAAQSDELGSSTKSVASSIGSSLVGSLVKMATQLAVNATVGQAVQSAATAAGAANAAALAASYAPAAAAASLASFGANAVPASAGIASTYALTSTLSATSGGGKFAKGGVSTLSDMSNTVVSTPTKFAAGGSFNNQLGEAGPEAILPLQKTAGGELGVKADMSGSQGPQQAPQVNVPVRIVNVAEAPQDYLGSSEGEKQIVNIMSRNRGVLQ